MAACCAGSTPEGYDRVFSDRYASQLARQYRRHGLTAPAQKIVEYAVSKGIAGATVLEIGGGIGDIQLELLKHGAARTTNIKLSGSYESEANRLIQQAGFEGQMQRILSIDLATNPTVLTPFDIAILHRVVCCYPDYELLLTAAATHAQRMVVFSHPPHNWFTRFGTKLMNAGLGIVRSTYRAFSHDPKAMVAVLQRHGLVSEYRSAEGMWRIVGACRA